MKSEEEVQRIEQSSAAQALGDTASILQHSEKVLYSAQKAQQPLISIRANIFGTASKAGLSSRDYANTERSALQGLEKRITNQLHVPSTQRLNDIKKWKPGAEFHTLGPIWHVPARPHTVHPSSTRTPQTCLYWLRCAVSWKKDLYKRSSNASPSKVVEALEHDNPIAPG
jgi:hypothetical protein